VSKYHPVVFEFAGAERHLTVQEALALRLRIDNALAAIRVKCANCRCYVLPGEPCTCCSDELDEEIPW
jgi:hypothetical protein